MNNIYSFNFIVAAEPYFTNLIDSDVTKSLLNEDENLYNEEVNVLKTSKENSILPESEKVVTDDIHILLNNVETEGN